MLKVSALNILVRFLLFAVVFVFSIAAMGQRKVKDTTVADTVPRKPSFIQQIQKVAADETVRSIEKYRLARIAEHQEFLLKEVMNTTHQAKSHLKKGIDTFALKAKIDRTNRALAAGRLWVDNTENSYQSQRNQTVSTVILSKLLERATETRDNFVVHLEKVIGFRNKIDSLYSDSALYIFPNDSAAAMKILSRMSIAVKDIGPTDSLLDRTIAGLTHFRNELDMQVFNIGSALDDLEIEKDDLVSRTFNKEFENVISVQEAEKPFADILKVSFEKERLAFTLYVLQNRTRFIVLILLVLSSFVFLRSLKSKTAQTSGLDAQWKGQLVLRYQFLSAFVIVTSTFQFMFLEPPFIFSFCIWLLGAIALAIIFKNFITPYWLRFWLGIIAFFFVCGAGNFLLYPSALERAGMYVLGICGILYGCFVLSPKRRQELREIKIVYFIIFLIVAETASLLANALGRFNLAKSLMVTGFAGLIIAILFLWTIRFLNEGLALTAEIYKHPDRNLFYINFDKVGNKVPRFFYVFLVLGWALLAAKNFYGLNELAEPFISFLSEPRTVGDYTFTINSLFIFLTILLCSVVLSRLISFFASDSTDHSTNQKKKVTLGSWLLLVRIVVITSGVFLAFAATGLPLDRLTIILGALSVGIGLGLQGLVSNLVSGLIIAFEKPVNVGDMIEVDKRVGYMKSIGFRSSVVTMVDGSTIIIPNGDLLKDHLVNWTMGRKMRRMELEVEVAYGTDLHKTRDLLVSILTSNKDLVQSPSPVVLVKSLNPSSITIQLLFWGRIYQDLGGIRSEIITAIDAAFRAENIVIPVPQQALHIVTHSAQTTQNPPTG